MAGGNYVLFVSETCRKFGIAFLTIQRHILLWWAFLVTRLTSLSPQTQCSFWHCEWSLSLHSFNMQCVSFQTCMVQLFPLALRPEPLLGMSQHPSIIKKYLRQLTYVKERALWLIIWGVLVQLQWSRPLTRWKKCGMDNRVEMPGMARMTYIMNQEAKNRRWDWSSQSPLKVDPQWTNGLPLCPTSYRSPSQSLNTSILWIKPFELQTALLHTWHHYTHSTVHVD